MRVEYSSNNSGGSWWLKDADWKALEDAGWEVDWGGRDFCHSKLRPLFSERKSAAPNTCEENKCEGHRPYQTYAEAVAAGDRWLNALATRASKDFPALRDAVEEWERVTGQEASDEGCNCCGAPHSFWAKGADYGYVSGEDIVTLLYPDASGSKRDLARRLSADT